MTRVLPIWAVLLALAAPARGDTARPPILRDVDFAQQIGAQLPLNTPLRDEGGRAVTLRDFFAAGQPVVLVPAYYRCPQLCGLVQNGIASALRGLPLDVGRDFQVVTFSFDPSESSELAAKKKAAMLDAYRRQGADAGFHFLTGDADAVRRLTDAIGFHATWDAPAKQFAHASGIVLVTPEGRITKYFYGVEFAPRDVRLAIVEASANRIGTLVDQLLLFCFHYDPATGRYSRIALDAVRTGGVLTLAAMAGMIGWWLRRERLGRAAA